MDGIATYQMHGGQIRGCESEGHAWNGIDPGWGSGWGKIWQADGFLIRGNYIHDDELGIWVDSDNINIIIEYNVSVDNQWEGIKVEIGYDTIVRYNISMGNGITDDTFFFDSQIVVQNAKNVEVHNNFVRVSPGYGASIGIIEQDRDGHGPESHGPYLSDFPDIHDNVIIFNDAGDVGAVHGVTPPRSDYYDNITFQDNHYHFVEASPDTDRFNWEGSYISWEAWQAAGNDTTGSLTTSSDPSPPAPTIALAWSPLGGGKWRLDWEALRATEVVASGGWSGNRRLWGQEVVTPREAKTYTLTAIGPGGSHEQSVTLP
jgi:hypothetical protein